MLGEAGERPEGNERRKGLWGTKTRQRRDCDAVSAAKGLLEGLFCARSKSEAFAVKGKLFHRCREEGGHAVADVGEAGSEGAVAVEVEAVRLLGARNVGAGDTELPGLVVDGLGAVGFAGEVDAEREARAIGDDGIRFRLEGEDGDRGVPEDGEVADIAPEVGNGADTEGRGSCGSS